MVHKAARLPRGAFAKGGKSQPEGIGSVLRPNFVALLNTRSSRSACYYEHAYQGQEICSPHAQAGCPPTRSASTHCPTSPLYGHDSFVGCVSLDLPQTKKARKAHPRARIYPDNHS
jgi:hypothetical protein